MSNDDPTALETHAGTEVEIADNGDYRVDTSGADGGDIRLNLKGDAVLTIEFDGVPAVRISNSGGQVCIHLGDQADQRLVLGDAFAQFLNQFFLTKYDFHTHPTAMGPSGPPLPLFTGAQMGDDLLSDIAMTKKR